MRLLKISELEEKGIPYSRAHIYRLIHAKKFPEPVRLGANRIAFVESEIRRLAHQQGRRARRQAGGHMIWLLHISEAPCRC